MGSKHHTIPSHSNNLHALQFLVKSLQGKMAVPANLLPCQPLLEFVYFQLAP